VGCLGSQHGIEEEAWPGTGVERAQADIEEKRA